VIHTPKQKKKSKKKDDRWSFGGSWKPAGSNWKGPGGIKTTKRKKTRKRKKKK